MLSMTHRNVIEACAVYRACRGCAGVSRGNEARCAWFAPSCAGGVMGRAGILCFRKPLIRCENAAGREFSRCGAWEARCVSVG